MVDTNLLLEAAAAARERGRRSRALGLVGQALVRIRASAGARDPNLGPVLAALGTLHHEAGDLPAAARAYSQASQILAGLRGDLAAETRVQVLRALGDLRRSQARFNEARAHLGRALRCARRRLGPRHRETGLTENSLGMLCKYTGRFSEGERHYRKALETLSTVCGVRSVEVASVFHNLGGIAHEAGRFAEAEPLARRAFEIRKRLLGPAHPDTAADLAAWAAILDGLGRYRESEPIYRRVIPIFRRVGFRYDVAVNLHNWAVVRAAKGDVVGAKRLFRRALAMKTELWGKRHPDTGLTRRSLADLYPSRSRRGDVSWNGRGCPTARRSVRPATPGGRLGC